MDNQPKVYKYEIGDGEGRIIRTIAHSTMFVAIDFMDAVEKAKYFTRERVPDGSENTVRLSEVMGEPSLVWFPSVEFLRTS